jgi:hypothetical protein
MQLADKCYRTRSSKMLLKHSTTSMTRQAHRLGLLVVECRRSLSPLVSLSLSLSRSLAAEHRLSTQLHNQSTVDLVQALLECQQITQLMFQNRLNEALRRTKEQ